MHLRFNSNICLFLAVLFGGFLACKSRISTNALVKESDPTDVDYVTGIVKVIEGGKPVIMVGKKRSVVLLNSDVKLEVGQRIHVVGRYEVSDEFESSDEDEQIGRINVHQLIILKPQSEQRFPSALKYSMSILGELPFSRRTLLFAKVYDDMSKGLDTYLGAPRTLTSFHFEPHVMYDLHLYLVKLENAKKAFDRIQQKTGNVNVLAEEALSAFSSQSLIKPIVRLCLIDIDDTKVANIPIIAALMVKNIGTCQKNIERLYDSLTSLNLYLFRHNAGFDLSPYIAYFKAASASPYFNGRAKFPDDQNSILQEAFYRLYIAANEVDQTKRIRLVEEFNQLLIGHEQILAQPYFDQVKDVHERLKGLVSVNDPVGTYPLSQDSWAQLNVR
ncbi:MAG: hypothetical protein NTV34_10540, partial [Proteobacteria bacterium]|nr:hypothetical protein [Pseudomonadota bacterium]